MAVRPNCHNTTGVKSARLKASQRQTELANDTHVVLGGRDRLHAFVPQELQRTDKVARRAGSV